MKVISTKLENFIENYSHPSIALFRAVELRTVYEACKEIDFGQPSLDLGCGDGKIAKMIFDERFTFGIDNGEAKDVEEAVKNNIYEKVLLESAEKMSLKDESVNFVFSNCVIEHIPDNESVLREVSRILKPGGKFVFTVPSHKYPDYLYLTNKFASWGLGFLSRFYKYRRNKMLNQFHCYSKRDWEQKLSPHGLEILNHKYYASKETLMLWDQMALEIFLKKIVIKNPEVAVRKKFKKRIEEAYRKDMEVAEGEGAGLLIYCHKK